MFCFYSTCLEYSLIILMLPLLCITVQSNECHQVVISKDQILCACNSTFCDTIDPPTKAESGTYIKYTSTKKGFRFFKTYGTFTSSKNRNEGTIRKCNIKSDYIFTIDRDKKYQIIYGFGGAFTDSFGENLKSLPQEAQDKLLQSYFSPQGIEYNFGRVPIGGCDFSTHAYTLDDSDNDVNLTKFALTEEDFNLKIPFIKKAKEMSNTQLLLVGSAWSAPTWMKTNGKITGFGFLKDVYYQLWADYHVKFLEEYKKNGIDFWGLTTGNEPINGFVPLVKFNSMGWYPERQSEWIGKNLGPKIRNSNFSQIKIIMLDDQRFLLPLWAKKILSNKTADTFVDGIATHWYWDTIISIDRIVQTHNLFPNKFLMSSEASLGDKPWEKRVIPGSWCRGERYIDNIIEDLNNWMSAWIDWNMALDMEGGPNWVNNFVDSAILVNKDKQEFYKQPMFYAIGHCSKFIKPGAYRIDIKPQSYKKLNALAVINEDGSIVVVIHNKASKSVDVALVDNKIGKATVTLKPNSFNTIIYW